MKKVLVTGGAGYIGSITLIELLNRDYQVMVVDTLERGYKQALDRVKQITGKDFGFEKLDVRDEEKLSKVFDTFKPDAVIHFASYKSVGEAEAEPEKYFDNNVGGMRVLLDVMDKKGVKKIIFSSTAAVYGQGEVPISEKSPTQPLNAYGQSKLDMEKLSKTYADTKGFSVVALRYFNAVGAHKSGLIGEDPSRSTNLLPLVLQTLVGRRNEVLLFGNNFHTVDGSQERDYIDVYDLAIGHIAALEKNIDGFEAINLATGTPSSCLKVFAIAEEVAGKKLNYKVVGPRKGDPEIVYAISKKAKDILDWEPVKNIRDSITDQWAWTKLNPEGYK